MMPLAQNDSILEMKQPGHISLGCFEAKVNGAIYQFVLQCTFENNNFFS